MHLFFKDLLFVGRPKLFYEKKTESFSDLFEKINEIREILFIDTN
jgi:hypothetical protein